MRPPRVRLALAAATVALAGLVSVVLLNVLAARVDVRIDVTATGEHRLAPRSAAILDAIDRPVRVVIATDFSTVDPRARERVVDVLDQFRRRQPRLSTALIDVASPAGQARFRELVRELARAWEPDITRRVGDIRGACRAADDLAEALEQSIAPALSALRESVPGSDDAALNLRQYLESRAAEARLTARDLRQAAADADTHLATHVAGTPLPLLEDARQALLAPGDQAVQRLDHLMRDLSRLSPAVPDEVRRAARGLETLVKPPRDEAAVTLDALRRASPLDLERVVGALRAGSCVLVIAPPEGPHPAALAGIEPTELFPPGEWLDAAGLVRADVRRRAEELLATALGSLLAPHAPVVVLTHAERGSILPLFQAAAERLRLRGMDLAEWRVLQNPEQPPTLADLNPQGRRPVVYLSIAPDSSSGTGPGGEPAGPARAALLGSALALVAERGSPIILSMNPSVLPGAGQADPTVAVLSRFGLEARTGTPIVEEDLTPQGRTLRTEFAIRPSAGEHPIADAVSNLATAVVWPVAIVPTGTPTLASHAVIARLEGSERRWGESQWLRVWQTPTAQRHLLRDPPRFDAGRDLRLDDYPVIVAARRPLPDAGEQRLLAVGTNAWLVDPVIRQSAVVDGRNVDVFPGNLELLEAGVAWLTRRENLIARSATAQATPLVRDLEPNALFWLRAALIAGLPLAVLLLMAITRLLRR